MTMANALLPKAAKKILDGDIDLLNDTIKLVGVDTADYTRDDTDEFLSEIASGARVCTSDALASKTTTGGVFDAANSTFGVVTGDPFELLALIKDTGSDATSPIIAFIDTAGGSPIAAIPNGGEITITFDAAGIIELDLTP
jgi:hypothetical protein